MLPQPVIITKTDERYSRNCLDDIDPQNGAQPFSEVQAYLVELLRDRIVLGHDIQKDLKVISMDSSSEIIRLQGVALRLTPIQCAEVLVGDMQCPKVAMNYPSVRVTGPEMRYSLSYI